ncbi:hypothetical protein B0O99DRAFT_608000 [Bisporella sp. PMI_857]|nr:hypothetical protein B0O99DRAFT_608000 [Bisporella sp. PMI_857]
MASYSWNSDDLHKVSSSTGNSAFHINPQVTDFATTSFTPNKQMIQTTNSQQRTVFHQGLDSESLYNIPEGSYPPESLARTGKRAQAETGRSKLFASASTNKKDISHSTQFEAEPPTKKRKAPVKKRSQYSSVPSAILPVIGDQEQVSHQGTQLSIPKSTKRPRKKAKVNTSPNPVFKNPTITKPVSIPNQELIADASSSICLKTYQGFTTTQDMVELSKTTMDKFKKVTLSATSTDYQTHSLSACNFLPFNNDSQEYSNPPSSDYGLFPSSDSFFQQATWHEGQTSGLPDEQVRIPSSTGGILARDENPSTSKPSAGIDEMSVYKTTDLADVMPAKEGTTTEALSLQNEICLDGTSQKEGISQYELRSMNIRRQNSDISPAGENISSQPTIILDPKFHNEEDFSNVSDGELQAKVTPKDILGSFNLSDDLDDDDFLSFPLQGVASHNPEVYQPHLHSSSQQMEMKNLERPNIVVMERARVREEVDLAGDVSPQSVLDQLHLESEDEYPMSEGDVEELLNVTDLGIKITGRTFVGSFEPPESAQQTFNDERRVYDSTLQHSPPKTQDSFQNNHTNVPKLKQTPTKLSDRESPPTQEDTDWKYAPTNLTVRSTEITMSNASSSQALNITDASAQDSQTTLTKQGIASQKRNLMASSSSPAKFNISPVRKPPTSPTPSAIDPTLYDLDDSHEYEPLAPFIRPSFPSPIKDRSLIIGLSGQSFLRTCFRIGEMYQAGTQCASKNLDAVIELFSRVNFSSREPSTTKQHFQFMDLWHDRAPYPNGILFSYKTSGLAESESKVFLYGAEKKMARVLGRFKRDMNGSWVLHIINIRQTDWEEIRWTKRIVSGDDLVKKVGKSGLFASSSKS